MGELKHAEVCKLDSWDSANFPAPEVHGSTKQHSGQRRTSAEKHAGDTLPWDATPVLACLQGPSRIPSGTIAVRHHWSFASSPVAIL